MEGVSRVMGRLCSMDAFFLSIFLFSIFFLLRKIWKGEGSSGKSCGTEREMTPTYMIQGTGQANREEQR